jgi:TolB-like protein
LIGLSCSVQIGSSLFVHGGCGSVPPHPTALAELVGTPAVSQPASVQAAGKRLAVLELKAARMEGDVLDAFADAVRGGAVDGVAGRGVDVMTRENMMVLLREMGRKDCTEGDCEVETARNIGADFVVSGSVARVEQAYVVTLKLHETKGGSLLGTEMVQARSQLDLLSLLRERGQKLAARIVGSRPVALKHQDGGATPPRADSAETAEDDSASGPLSIDFGKYDEGDFPDGYGGLRIFKAFGGNVLGSPSAGMYEFTIDHKFPRAFKLVAVMAGDTGNSSQRCMTMSLLASKEDLSMFICPHPVGRGKWDVGFLNTKMRGSKETSNETPTAVEIRRLGDTFKVYVGDTLVLSLKQAFERFRGLRIKFQAGGALDVGGLNNDGYLIKSINVTPINET